MPYVKFTTTAENGEVKFQFDNGIEIHRNGFRQGGIGFPIRHQGDVFHLVRTGQVTCAADIPKRFRAW